METGHINDNDSDPGCDFRRLSLDMTEDEFVAEMSHERWWPWEVYGSNGPDPHDAFQGDPFAFQWAKTFVAQWDDEADDFCAMVERDPSAFERLVSRPFFRAWKAWKTRNLS